MKKYKIIPKNEPGILKSNNLKAFSVKALVFYKKFTKFAQNAI